MTKSKQIIVMGGHGMNLTNPKNLKIHNYLLKASNQKNPKIAFLGTATGDSSNYISLFYSSFSSLECKPSHLELFMINHENWQEYLLSQDIIYVGGGNTFNMLAIWKAWGVDAILKKCYEKGIILTGSSAGSVCWFSGGNSDSFSQTKLYAVNGLGFLPFSHSPHYDGEQMRRPNYQDLIQKGELDSGYGIDDYAGIHFINQKIHKVWTTDEKAGVYFVAKNKEKVVEKRLEAELI
jgi:dipeptidase E